MARKRAQSTRTRACGDARPLHTGAPIRTGGVDWAVLTKDLRTASRTPGYAFLTLLPLLDAVAIGLWTYVSSPAPTDALNLALAAVATAALLANLLRPRVLRDRSDGLLVLPQPAARRAVAAARKGFPCGADLTLLASGMVLGLTLLRCFRGPFARDLLAGGTPRNPRRRRFWSSESSSSAPRGAPIVNLYARGLVGRRRLDPRTDRRGRSAHRV